MKGPITTVAAILTDGDEISLRILLTRRSVPSFKGKWCLPGGHINELETARDAISREVREETGVSFEPAFFHCFDEILPAHSHHHVLLVFEGKAIGEPTKSQEVDEFRWLTISEALELDLAFRNREVLEAYSSWLQTRAKEGLLAEYAGLRGEIARRIGIRWQIEAFTLVFSTGFFAVAFANQAANQNVSDLLLILVPCFVALLAAIWAHNNSRIGELGNFIEKEIEPKCIGLQWERSLRKRLGASKYHIRTRAKWFSLLVFYLSCAFIPLAAMAQGKLKVSLLSHVVLAVNLVALVLIFWIIQFGRAPQEGRGLSNGRA
jgi:8-oxo-dGTP diphosphatase